MLEAGEPLVLFPEGERKSGPTVQPLFDGAAYVALKAGVPIVPVGIGGSEAVMPKGARFIRPRKVHVIVGAPIMPAIGGRGARAARRRSATLTDELHADAAGAVRRGPAPRRRRPASGPVDAD